MYQRNHSRNRWENQCIDAKCKNKHNKSRNKLSRKTSNSLKQEFRNGTFNLQLFDRLYANQANKHYSLQHFLECEHIYDDYDMIIHHSYSPIDTTSNHHNNNGIIWQCARCTFINMEPSLFCKICEFPYHDQSACTSDHDTNSIASSSESTHSCVSEPLISITTHSSLASYIITTDKPNNRKRIRRKKHHPHPPSFQFNDESYKKYKKYMKKRKTSIIAHKKEQNGYRKWNAVKDEKRKKDAQKLYAMYQTLYLSQKNNPEKEEMTSIIQKMAGFIPKHKQTNRALLLQDKTETNPVLNCKTGTCKVCYCETQLISMNTYCTHCMICAECLKQYLRITIREDEHIMPWLLCPAQDCKAPIHPDLVLQYATTRDLCTFGVSFVYKHLQRCSFWMDCPDGLDKKCKFGWIIMEDDEDCNAKCIELECDACGYCHRLQKEELKKEQRKADGFAELIASGVMRECPKCSYPAMKDYGMCNVMHCGKCSVYWNWRTKEFGSSTSQVKQKARNEGTLWEPGELSYQQNLQNNHLSEFVALLAKNGIKYDPNYRRGT